MLAALPHDGHIVISFPLLPVLSDPCGMLCPVYTERTSVIGGAVVWRRTTVTEHSRILPDGCMDLMWVDGELQIAGPDTYAHVMAHEPGTRYVGLRFAPGAGPSVFGVPACELRDQRVPLAAVWPSADVRRMAERVTDSATRGRALERIAMDRLAGTPPFDWSGVTDVLRRTGSVARAAELAGLGERQLHRRCLAAFGYGPKTLARILRLNRALDLARTGIGLADVAAAVGYADQAHLARDTRELAGVPMRRLLG
jgi:AraC-like DNA-binding protein